MYGTPIFNRLHLATFTDQCEACHNEGWPVGMFTCIADDMTCIDY